MVQTTIERLIRTPLLLNEQEKTDKTGILSWIKSLDAFPKFDTAYLRHTSSGGIGSIVCFTIMGLLMAAEMWKWFAPNDVQEFVVDHSLTKTLPLEFSISIATSCPSTRLFYSSFN